MKFYPLLFVMVWVGWGCRKYDPVPEYGEQLPNPLIGRAGVDFFQKTSKVVLLEYWHQSYSLRFEPPALGRIEYRHPTGKDAGIYYTAPDSYQPDSGTFFDYIRYDSARFFVDYKTADGSSHTATGILYVDAQRP